LGLARLRSDYRGWNLGLFVQNDLGMGSRLETCEMAFTKEQRIKGMKASIASPKTPARLKEGLKKALKKLERS
jgi:hypothetical protein